jgi:amino-acid N-acetyltransferase
MSAIEIVDAGPADLDDVLRLLDRTGLPADGLAEHFTAAVVARRDGHLVGSAALELYSEGALLRSVAVDPGVRGVGLGQRLTEAAISRARAHRVPALYLLTTTAENFFPRFGFTRITRDEVPPSVQQSIEFRGACPSSAFAMMKSLADLPGARTIR